MFDLIYILTTYIIGLFAGSLLMEGIILVPYWRRMNPDEFFRLHGTLGPVLFRYFAPLTGSAVALGIIAALVDMGRTPVWTITGILCALTLAIFYIYFRKANAGFAKGLPANEALAGELKRWATWHWLRTILMLGAFGLSVFGHFMR